MATMEYISKGRADSVLQALNGQRASRQFCDISLRVGDKLIYAHRCVLSASSDYFRALFLGHFGDNKAGECQISSCQFSAVQAVVTFMYSGRIRISLHNVDDILEAADYLCLREVKSFCADLLKRHLDETNCIQIKALTDRFSLDEIRSDVIDFLAPRMSGILAMEPIVELPFDYVYPLVSDGQLNYVREADLLNFIFRWIDYSPEERRQYTRQLIGCVDFAYLGCHYIRENVVNVKYVTDVLLPGQLEELHIKLSEREYPTRTEDMIVCRSRSANNNNNNNDNYNNNNNINAAGGRLKLLFYAVKEDSWYSLDDYPDDDLLAGLESMVSDRGSLYVLSTSREDVRGYAHGRKESKRLWKLSYDRARWERMPSPVDPSAGQSRLVPHVRGLYLVDRAGFVQKLDQTTDSWRRYSDCGFEHCPNATTYLLPMPMDKYIYVLRAYSEGYAFDHAETSFSLHRYDTDRYSWTTLAHIDAAEFDLGDRERVHGYEATTSALLFRDALGLSRMRYDIDSGRCTAVDPGVVAPKFVTEIWGSAEYGQFVYFSGRMSYERPIFMLFDHGKTRFKMVSSPPLNVSGIMCHVVVPRSFKEALTACT